MKTKLFTQNTCIAILMALALAFSVQGTADALSFTSQITRTDRPNISFVYPGQTFDVQFTVRLERTTEKQPSTSEGTTTDIAYADTTNTRTEPAATTNYTHIVDAGYDAGDTHYYAVRTQSSVQKVDAQGADITGQTVTRTLYTRNWVTESEAYYYNDEAIDITTPTGINIVSINGTLVTHAAGAAYVLSEKDNFPGTTTKELSSATNTIKVKCMVSSGITPGPQASALVVSDQSLTPASGGEAADYRGVATAATAPPNFTITVVRRPDRTALPSISTVSTTGIIRAHDTRTPITVSLTGTTSTYHEVDFAIEAGSSGTLSEKQDGTGNTGKSLTLYTDGSSPAVVTVYYDPGRKTGKVRVAVAGRSTGSSNSAHARTVTIFYHAVNLEADLSIGGPGGNGQIGVTNTRLPNPFVVKVIDGSGRAISGQAVTFEIPDTTNTDPRTGSPFSSNGFPSGAAAGTYVLFPHEDFGADPSSTGTAIAGYDPLVVKTDNSGEAKVYLKLGDTASAGLLYDYQVLASFEGAGAMFEARAIDATTATRTLEIDTANSDQAQSVAIRTRLSKPLVVRVLDGGISPVANAPIRFTATDGELTVRGESPQLTDSTAPFVVPNDPHDRTILTNRQGKAWINYTAGNSTGPVAIRATAFRAQDSTPVDIATTPTDVVTFSRINAANTITFSVNVGGSTTNQNQNQSNQNQQNQNQQNQNQQNQNQNQQLGTITLIPPRLSGAAGEVEELVVSAGTATASVTGNAAFRNAGGTLSRSGSIWSVRLPNAAGTAYELTVSASGYGIERVPVTVTAAAAPTSGTLRVTAVGARSGNQQAIRVSASPTPTSALVVTLTGVTNPTTITIPANSSSRTVAATLASASAAQPVTVSATGYDDGQVTIRAAAPTSPGTDSRPTPPPSVVAGGSPSRITISGLAAHSGTVNQPLDAPLSVRVLDANGVGVAGARVIFRVTGSGQGRLSQRGNGRAIPKETDRNGFARADFTPLGAGTITVEAEARGVSERVTFTITTGSVPPGPGDPTPSTTTTVSPVVNAGVPASSRPPLLWVSGGKIYALVGSEVKVFISTVDNAISLAVGGGKVYWTAKTSDTHGTLNSANLDGTDAQELRTLWGVPRGITVDPTGSKLYWVDAVNRLQSSNLDGSGIENVLRNLSDPKDVAVSGGNAYWVGNGDGTDTLVFINLSDPKKEIHPIAATSGIYGGLTIANGKLYWTEQTSDTHGTLNSANLDGTQVKELRDEPIWGAPIGIAVDTARSRLYWTDAAGRLQRSNLDGSGIHNVAKGLGTPGDMVLSNSITEPAETSPTTTTPTASKSKYDINEDGTVDTKDTDALIVAVAAGVTDAKYDVNDDGTVDINDVVAVTANRDKGAAAAPALLGNLKLTAVEVERLQEQIEFLVASGDRSPAALKTLIYLQQLIVMARPEKTQLLANYPNPFNPETWIPYELATDTDVRITIYNAQGVVIRTLQLGQQSAGYYTDRERAAYWDGRNALGEQVASGIYFYQLQTDEMSTLRKMVILK